MEHSLLKKYRLKAKLTQSDISKFLGVTKSEYRYWESGKKMPQNNQLSELADILGIGVEALTQSCDYYEGLTFDRTSSDKDSYYGEVAIHFQGDNSPILLPITISSFHKILDKMDDKDQFLEVISIDNRSALINKSMVTDIFLSDDAYDDYGPEVYSDMICIVTSDSYWDIVEHNEDIEYLEKNYSPKQFNEVLESLYPDEQKLLQSLEREVEDGLLNLEEIEKQLNILRDETSNKCSALIDRATYIDWQHTTGKTRSQYVSEDEDIFKVFSEFKEQNNSVDIVQIECEGSYRHIIINPNKLNYIVVPTHRFNKGKHKNQL